MNDIIKKLNERIKLNIVQKIIILKVLSWIAINMLFFEVLAIINTSLASSVFSIIWLPDFIILFLGLIFRAGKTEVEK